MIADSDPKADHAAIELFDMQIKVGDRGRGRATNNDTTLINHTLDMRTDLQKLKIKWNIKRIK